MKPGPLLTFRETVLPARDGLGIGPINWSLHRGQRVRLEATAPEMADFLFLAIAGRAAPVSGSLLEPDTVIVQGDFLLKEQIDGNRSIRDYLQLPDAPEFVWLENRRRSVGVLLDKLGLDAHVMRHPIKLQAPAVAEKFLVFRFLTSSADLLLGREIFTLQAPEIRQVLQMRWGDFPGTLIAATSQACLPGMVDTEVRVAADGGFTVISLPETGG